MRISDVGTGRIKGGFYNMKKNNKKLKKRETPEKEFEPAFMPDMGKLREYMKEGRGKRTWKEYAELCGTNAPKFSRIMQKELVRPLKASLLRDIVNYAENPLDLTEVMRAGGWIPKKAPGRDKYSIIADQEDNERVNRQRLVKNTIERELWDRGYDLQRWDTFVPWDSEAGFSRSSLGLGYDSDIGYSFTLLCEKDNSQFWWHFIENINEMQGDEIDARPTQGAERDRRSKVHMKSIMNSCAHLFLKDIWEPETIQGKIKYSFVFVTEGEYNLFWNTLTDANIRVNSDFSLVLIDSDKMKVKKEEFIPRRDEQSRQSVFEEPIEGALDTDEYTDSENELLLL